MATSLDSSLPQAFRRPQFRVSGSPGLPSCLTAVLPPRHWHEPRARAGTCEGLKRTTTGSEPDILPPSLSVVLDKTVVFRSEGSRRLNREILPPIKKD